MNFPAKISKFQKKTKKKTKKKKTVHQQIVSKIQKLWSSKMMWSSSGWYGRFSSSVWFFSSSSSDVFVSRAKTGPVTPLLSSSPITGTRSNIQGTSGMSGSVGRMNKTPSSSSNRPMSPPSSSSLIKSSTHHGNFTLCLPREYDVVVYRAQGGGNASEFIQVIKRVDKI